MDAQVRITHLYELLTVSCARDGLVRFNSNMNKNKPCGLERLNSLEPRGSNRSWAVVKYCRSGLLMSGIISSFCALFFLIFFFLIYFLSFLQHRHHQLVVFCVQGIDLKPRLATNQVTRAPRSNEYYYYYYYFEPFSFVVFLFG